ncbi:MAG: FdtA/QdtA family cupin domain-containing protein [Synergistes sp.]|nr:FdtA/QdtA family cupin domain-containing protein [Synergistes sp.]
MRTTNTGCKIINIATIAADGAGQISFFEANIDIPFEIKRIYYISRVPKDAKRGGHAHKELKQLLFCPYGSVKMLLDDGKNREEIIMDDPAVGLVIDKPVWREMRWLEKNSVLCVAASDYYTPEDYIRDYDEFIEYKNMEFE